MPKRRWKPRFRVVPGTKGEIWYCIQYLWFSSPVVLAPTYRLFNIRTLRWLKEREIGFAHKRDARISFSYCHSFTPYFGWAQPSYWRRELVGYTEKTSHWTFSKRNQQAVINFFIDEGYAYAKQGCSAGLYFKGKSHGRLADLEGTFIELALCDES